MTSSPGLEVQPDDLALIRTWIVKQEQFREQNGRPAPVTTAQRKAFRALLSAIKAPAGENHVGTLQEFCQGRHLSVAYIDGGTAEGWTCRATIQGSFGQNGAHQIVNFPMEGYGLRDGHLPGFSSKGSAKQHAASCAIDWLIFQGLMMPSHSSDDASSSRSTPTSTYTQPVPSSTPPNGASSGPSSGPSSDQRSRYASVDDESILSEALSSGEDDVSVNQFREFEPAIAQPQQNGFVQNEAVNRTGIPLMRFSDLVQSLCINNNIPQPRYKIEPCLAPGCYTGSAVFEDYGDDTLQRLQSASIVSEAHCGQQAIKEAIAAKLLGPLREIGAKRREELRMLWQHGPPRMS